jgi:lipid-A-disaccharide synthase
VSQASRPAALIVAGEASGDQHGAALAAAVQQLQPVEWFGIGGEQMAAAQVDLVTHARELSVLGIFELIRHLPRLHRIEGRLRTEIARRRPRFAVLVDLPGHNLRLSAHLHRRGIPVVYFIAPQLWAWRPRRMRFLRRHVCKLLCIFPFEESYFRRAGVEVEYVGHPLLDRVRASLDRERFLARYRLKPDRPTVCLLPGSRNQEISRHLPPLLEAAAQLAERQPLQFTLVQADTVDPALVTGLIRRYPSLSLTVVADSPYDALAWCNVAVISSGTATVEALLLQTPMVVVYRVATPSWWIGKALVRTAHYSMVNLLADRALVPELIQSDFTPTRVATEVERLLSDPAARQRIQQELGEIKQRLGPPGAIERAARAVVATVGCSPTEVNP